MKRTLYIIHGYGATPNDHWFKYLQEKLTNEENKVILVSLPNSTSPEFDSWQLALDKQIEKVDEETFFIGHSLGCITLLHYLTNLSNKVIIGGLIMVSGFNKKIPSLPKIDSFNLDDFTKKAVIDFDRITSRSPIYLVAAKDDYIVPFESSMDMVREYHLEFKEFTHGGHFLGSDGFYEFPFLLSLQKDIWNK